MAERTPRRANAWPYLRVLREPDLDSDIPACADAGPDDVFIWDIEFAVPVYYRLKATSAGEAEDRIAALEAALHAERKTLLEWAVSAGRIQGWSTGFRDIEARRAVDPGRE
jgi:hypothetical protein